MPGDLWVALRCLASIWSIYRRLSPDGLSYVYVGWLENALKRLQQHGLHPTPTLQVSTSATHLRNFLKSLQLK